jgi:DNA-binding HxlR family transcriptional regulator
MTRDEARFSVHDAPLLRELPATGPMRDVLTGRSRRRWSPLAHALAATGDQWTLLIVLQLADGASRIARLQERLPGISTGVLDRHLHNMAALGLLSRTRYREVPPRVEVSLTDSGRELLPIAGALARWGLRHTWPVSSTVEHMDVHACLGLLPIMLESALPNASIELVLTPVGDHLPQTFRIEDGKLLTVGRVETAATTRVEGDEMAWTAALGPSSDYSLLTVTGNERIGRQFLNALPRRGG